MNYYETLANIIQWERYSALVYRATYNDRYIYAHFDKIEITDGTSVLMRRHNLSLWPGVTHYERFNTLIADTLRRIDEEDYDL